MGARQKLNRAFVNGALVVAAVLGLAAESWSVFAITAAITLTLSWLYGDIRSGGPNRRRR